MTTPTYILKYNPFHSDREETTIANDLGELISLIEQHVIPDDYCWITVNENSVEIGRGQYYHVVAPRHVVDGIEEHDAAKGLCERINASNWIGTAIISLQRLPVQWLTHAEAREILLGWGEDIDVLSHCEQEGIEVNNAGLISRHSLEVWIECEIKDRGRRILENVPQLSTTESRKEIQRCATPTN